MKKILLAAAPLILLFAACSKGLDPEIILNTTDISCTSEGRDVHIALSANFDYDAAVEADAASWITVVSKLSNELTLKLAANTGVAERVGKVNISYNGKTLKTVTITQTEPEPQLIYAAPENKNFIRMAYFPSYRGDALDKMPDDYLQTVDVACYAFASINADYTVSLQTPATLSKLITRCNKLGIKVVLSFAGDTKIYQEMVKKGSTRKKFINSVMSIVDQYKLDGVDNDWEWPSANDHTKQGNLLLMREFSNILHDPQVKKTLSMAITSGVYSGGYQRGIDPGVYDCCDWFGIMIYDDSNPHSSYDMMVKSYNWWVSSAKMPAYKFIGGMPAYGRSTGDNWSKSKTYASLVDSYGADPDADSATADGLSFNYNGRKTIAKKTQFLIDKKVGGYFFWEAGQDKTDDKSLLRTAADIAGSAI